MLSFAVDQEIFALPSGLQLMQKKSCRKLRHIISFKIILATPYMCVYELYNHTISKL